MRVLQTIMVKHVALITTKMIMNVTSPVEAPRNPAMNLASAVFILGWAGAYYVPVFLHFFVELYRESNEKTRRLTVPLLVIKLSQNRETIHTTSLHKSI